MTNKILKLVGYKSYPPLVVFTENCRFWSIKNCSHPGADVEFLRILLDFAKIDYELIQQDLNSTQILDAIANGTADMSIIALRMVPERMEEVSFTTPINFNQFGYYVKKLNTLESDQFLLKTFQIDVYFALVFAFFVIAAVYWLCFRRLSYKEWTWLAFSSFFNQTNQNGDKRLSFRTLTISWWFFSFVTICFYQARMKYFLTVPLEKGIDFLNLNQVLDKLELGEWMAYQNEDGYKPSMYCTPLQCRRIQLLEKAKRIVTLPAKTDLDSLISKPYTLTFDAYNYDYAPNDINVVDKGKDHLFIRDNTISIEMLGYAISKNRSVELELINRAISHFFSSYSNVRARYANSMYQYATDDLKNGAVTLTLLHMNILFYVYLALIVVSIVALGVELLHFRHNWRSDGKNWWPENKNWKPKIRHSSKDDVSFGKKTLLCAIKEKIVYLYHRGSYDFPN